MTHHLRLLETPERSLAALAGDWAPRAPRCRPGDFPTAVTFTADEKTLRRIHAHAREAGVTPELWTRLVIEARVALGELADLGPMAALEIVAALGDEDSAQTTPQLATTPGPNDRYVKTLGSIRLGAHRTTEGELELLLNEEQADRWRLAAIVAGLSMNEWMCVHLDSNLECPVVTWEAQAASQRLSLREWVYASWARSMARRIAAPSTRLA